MGGIEKTLKIEKNTADFSLLTLKAYGTKYNMGLLRNVKRNRNFAYMCKIV